MGNDLEQLMLLKQMTAMTGLLHDAQSLQLKYYPLILTHCIKCEFVFNFDNKSLSYKLLKFNGNPPKDIKKRFNLLKSWVKTLLGDEYIVTIEGYQEVERAVPERGRSVSKRRSSKRRADRNRK